MPLEEEDLDTTGSSGPRVLIVILNWNSHEETIEAVRSALKTQYANFRILVVDNGSTDGSVEALRRMDYEGVDLVELPENQGFTGGCNLGLERALEMGMQYVWLLNSDATTDPRTLGSMVRLAESDPSIGLVSPRIASMQEPTKNLDIGGLYDPAIPNFTPTKDLARIRDWAENKHRQLLLMGTALLIKMDLVRAIGLLDQGMFAYWEDTDYSLRSVQAGFRNAIDFDTVIYHTDKIVGPRPYKLKPHYWYYMVRNEIRFWKKHASGEKRWKALWWAYRHKLIELKVMGPDRISRGAVLAGLWDGWLGRTGPYHPNRRMPRLVAALVERHSG